ncbi:MAG: hypothetical protein IJ863_01910 [Spirochaetales bacterium]|nr:hypothetical protein [Spirochaetales bacterium]
MKKPIIVFLLISFLLMPLLAEGDDVNRTGQLRVNAYYKGSEGFSLLVKDYTGRRLLFDTNAVVGVTHLNNTGKIFEWGCSMYENQTVDVTFSFTRIQAYLSGSYYSPAYTVSMDVQNSNLVLSRTSETIDSDISDHRYDNRYEFRYSGTLSVNPSLEGEYVTYGACYLNINTNDKDYKNWSPGDYEYGCQVSVGVTWQ